jgi:hypothetical protein
VKVNRWKDLIERVGWTGVQAGAAAGITALTTSDLTWGTGLKFVGIAVALAVLKVITAQQVGSSGDGAAIPGGITK